MSQKEDKLKLVLDIEEDLKEMSEEVTIIKIMDMKDYVKDFPNVKQFISTTEPNQSKLFNFKFFNLVSYILYLRRGI